MLLAFCLVEITPFIFVVIFYIAADCSQVAAVKKKSYLYATIFFFFIKLLKFHSGYQYFSVITFKPCLLFEDLALSPKPNTLFTNAPSSKFCKAIFFCCHCQQCSAVTKHLDLHPPLFAFPLKMKHFLLSKYSLL